MVDNSRSLGDWVLEFVSGASSLTVVAPFAKEDAMARIVDVLEEDCSLTLYTRWHVHEIAIGVSDLETFEVVESFGGRVFLQPYLHAKAFVRTDSCLVGSANVTLTGLGWSTRPAIEVLVEATRKEPAVERMLRVLEETSSRADSVIRNEIERLADRLDRPRTGGWQYPAAEGGEREWNVGEAVPQYNVPESVWPAYQGQRSKDIVSLVRRDLQALGVPGGIQDKDEFDAIVAGALTQGLTGRLIQECSGLNAVDAADRFREVLEEAGVDTPSGELGRRYQVFVRWVSHFVSGRTLRATGFSIS